VIALPPASRTAVHLRAGTKAGNRIADPIALLTHHNGRSFPFLEVRSPVRAPTSHHYRPAESLFASFPVGVDAPNSP
jgi:hypothetical protein